MQTPDTIDVIFKAKDGSHHNDPVSLKVEEFQPIDPAAYQLTAGWACFSGHGDDDPASVEYFVDESGIVWRMPENVECGVAPEIKAEADRFEALWKKWEDEEAKERAEELDRDWQERNQ